MSAGNNSGISDDLIWQKCNSCKKPIIFGTLFWVCNVSTCNRLRTGLRFCSVTCWDAHLPGMNHRESWAEERRAPSIDEWAATLAAADEPKKRPRKKETADAVASPSAPISSPKVILRRKPE